ncbi:MAG: 4-hydroxy-3-methylbut-2-enyl diphosphate reductase [Candidatus Caenarcaniphilales bacterium]|jgi:4-hydroxy-3-methylbut-2-enyl diphosphate reductase|nr:4-hydroxy-3-methylbut-2-enyl diphosphate reductase [Candidatus Caenarcaniphilales bacterium]
MKIILAEPRGFCAGVNRAIEIVELALKIYGTPLYVRHEIVHNHHVVNDLKNKGVVFVETLEEVPDNSVLIFSAHGTSPKIIDTAKERGLKFVDAVCPLVTKVHLEISKALKTNRKVIYIGHKGHQEVLGALGYAKENEEIFLVEKVEDIEELAKTLKDDEISVTTQTTLSVDDTKEIMDHLAKTFSKIEFPKSDDICYATQNRQDAVKELVKICDHILIIGSRTSSNTLRLLELAIKSGKSAELIPNPLEYRPSEDLNNKIIGISSGASAPDFLVQDLIKQLGSPPVTTLVFKEEHVEFPLPKELIKN